MKLVINYIKLLTILPLFMVGCTKEEQPIASEDLKIPQKFAPDANADPRVKALYTTYNLWVRMDFDNWKEVTNAILDQDPTNRTGVGKIEDADRSDALTYAETLLSNVPEKYVRSFFPLEFFFVKSYGVGYWSSQLKRIGRSRLIICWPNQLAGTIPVTDPGNHYYKDSVLASQIWGNLGAMITARMEEPIQAFVVGGKAYDNGQAYDRIQEEYYKDYDLQKRNAAFDELARSGGYITASGSRNFDTDFSNWLTLLTTESYDNIAAKYLANSPARAQKYNALMEYFNGFGWDIQETGNKYRAKFEE